MITRHLGLGSNPPKRVGPGKGFHRGCFETWISRVFDLKTFEPSGENPHCWGLEQCQPEGFTVHVNSDMIFGANFYDVE